MRLSSRKITTGVRWGLAAGLLAATTTAHAGVGDPIGFVGIDYNGSTTNTVLYVDPATRDVEALFLEASGWTFAGDTNDLPGGQGHLQSVSAAYPYLSAYRSPAGSGPVYLWYVGTDGNLTENNTYILGTDYGVRVTSSVSAYRRGDGVDTAVYTDAGDLFEYSSGAPHDMTAQLGAPSAYLWTDGSILRSADPYGYVRGDGKSAIVYVGTNGHIYEWSLSGNTWNGGDLTALSGSVLLADPRDPVRAYLRSDGVDSVVFLGSDRHIHEIYLSPTGWRSGDLSQQSGNFNGVNSPGGYARSDGTNSVLSLDATGNIIEYTLAPGASQWTADNLTAYLHAVTVQPSAPAGMPLAPPSAYVRSDNVNAVVYRGTNGHIVELSLPKGGWWSANNLF